MDPIQDTNNCNSPSRESASIPQKNKGKKRKRSASDIDCSSDDETLLPDNSILVEKNLHASAVKNNLTEKNVKHILKKVVTNDHVLALVQLREEEESANTNDNSQRPKLTRSKVKELMKCSPKSSAWNIELTPIDKIPVKTHPEVEALIAQDLPDESDEEYEPPHDDNQSDDDQTVESFSDVDSLPRTPATPHSHIINSPGVVNDGPFKVPQDIKTPTRKRLFSEEEDATIALRTRSKLSLSATPIEHIEESFVPPDDLPVNDVDDLWSQFLTECLNPGLSFKTEDDDEADPEYNVAADPDAGKDDEELADNTLIKISKKELSDLVTELFHVMPDGTIDDSVAEKIINSSAHLPDCKSENLAEDTSQHQNVNGAGSSVAHVYSNFTWNGKQESAYEEDDIVINCTSVEKVEMSQEKSAEVNGPVELTTLENVPTVYQGPQASKREVALTIHPPPLLLQDMIEKAAQSEYVEIQLPTNSKDPLILPEQILILQQQLRQHIQLASSSFMQIYVHPRHWSTAPIFKGFVQTLYDVLTVNPKSVVNVCNLVPAQELLNTWQETLSKDTPENRKIVEYLKEEAEKCIRRVAQNTLYLGQFHPTFMHVVANSPVFLYPYLLPPIPYRAETKNRHSYLVSEDELIALGLDEFWEYVENNPQLYKPPTKENNTTRWGLMHALDLVTKYMFPWMPQRMLSNHIGHVRKQNKPDNPILQFLYKREIIPVKHVLLPYNPSINLFEQPEHEMPLMWVRFLSENSSTRAEKFVKRRKRITGVKPQGVEVAFGKTVEAPMKNPLPLSFTKPIIKNRYLHDKEDEAVTTATTLTSDNPIITIQFGSQNGNTNVHSSTSVDTSNFTNEAPTVYNLVETEHGAYLMPAGLHDSTKTTNSLLVPVTSTNVQISEEIIEPTVISQNGIKVNADIIRNTPKPPKKKLPIPKVVLKRFDDGEIRKSVPTVDHCKCCELLRSYRVRIQTKITDFFNNGSYTKSCPCRNREYPKITNKLKILLNNFKNISGANWTCLYSKTPKNSGKVDGNLSVHEKEDPEDLAFVLKYQFKLWSTIAISKNRMLSKRIHSVLSKFYFGCNPVILGKDMEKHLLKYEPDLFSEFLAFLTGDQADELLRFSDYFIVVHMNDFLARLEKEIDNVTYRQYICNILVDALETRDESACNICSEVLPSLKHYPSMAEYFFSLFPHRHKIRSPKAANKPMPMERNLVEQTEVSAGEATLCECAREESDDNTDDVEMDVEDNEPRLPEIVYIKGNINEAIEKPVNNKLESTQVKCELNEDRKPIDMLSIQPTVIEDKQINSTSDYHEETVAHHETSAEREVNPEIMDCKGRNVKITTITDPVSNKRECIQVKREQSDQSKQSDKSDIGPAERRNSAGDDENIHNNRPPSADRGGTPHNMDSSEHNGELNTDDMITVKKEVQGHDTGRPFSHVSAPKISVQNGVIKLESIDWSREEDKLILNTLKESLIQDDSLCSVEHRTIESIAESLPNKSLVDVEQRIMYILQVMRNEIGAL